ncbi:MAG: rhamnan synthesis F family protein [Candidatus Saccharimonadales bacterium]
MKVSARVARSVTILTAFNFYKDKLFTLRNTSASNEAYFVDKNGDFKKTSSIAVVLHLYHTDTWEEIFAKKLKCLNNRTAFDLYVTMPLVNEPYIEVIRKTFPLANILIVPNRGRDVLPFIKTAIILNKQGYSKVLKIHSKKSKHREDFIAEGGDAWLTNTLDTLIPEDDSVLNTVIKKVQDKRTGMIGTQEYYYPLKMYLGNNREDIDRILKSINNNLLKGDTSKVVNDIGYFGGTMFWIDLHAIRDVLSIAMSNFPKEAGQTDGTIAHALERVFCILPQLQGLNLYGVSDTKVIQLKKGDGRVPDWYYEHMSPGRPFTSIIVPVYGDWPSLSLNIASLKKAIGNREDVSVHYVNDCGPEADVLEDMIKRNISGMSNFYYHKNKKNLGFVKNCNNAVFNVVDQSQDVLLLNSDTKVTNDFYDQMKNVLYSEDDIAAVTSRSNNATIWSVPMTAKLAHHRAMSYILYRFIKNGLPDKYITPTIHGFCVLIRRTAIKKHGLFDEVYGKGYGEENDFAMRLHRSGLKCAVANKSFVFHYESRSFGNDARDRQIEENERILDKRYPEYRQLVQEYWDSIKEPLK